MKILMTGSTPKHINSQRLHISYQLMPETYVDGLRELGHEVDWRPVDIDDNSWLDRYDVVWLGICPSLSRMGSHLFHAWRVLIEAERTGMPIQFYVDDWHFRPMIANLNTILNTGSQRRLFDDRVIQSRSKEGGKWALANRDLIDELVVRLRHEPWPTTILPKFAWGDGEKLASQLREVAPDVEFVDPTSLTRQYSPTLTPPELRKRRWILAALSPQFQWLDKMDLQWPVQLFGGKTVKEAAIERGMDPPEKVDEAEIVQRCAESWGVMSQPYTMLFGTGWWRVRFIYAIQAHSVLLMDPREAPQLGHSYTSVLPFVDRVERGSTTQLATLAEEQAATFLAKTDSKERYLQELDRVVRRAV